MDFNVLSRTQWIILASLMAVMVAYLVRHHPPYGLPSRGEPMQVIAIHAGGKPYAVEIARTPYQLQRGLQHRHHLDPQSGMLFVLPRVRPADFWMKDTKLALDMLFLDQHGRVIRIHRNVPPCPGDPCPVYSSGLPVRYVLELAAGQAADIQPGDRIDLTGVSAD